MSDRGEAAEVRRSWLTDSTRIGEVSELFLASVHPFYPSHGDLMYGRADAPGVWAEDFEQVHLLELAEVEFSDGPFSSPGLRVAIAEARGVLVGLALVAVVEFDAGRQEPVRYARLDDIVVRPDMRGLGSGAALARWVEGALRDSGVPRIFVESGRGNVAAHRFFERNGFSRISISLMKDL